ncbi:MAG: hypothetical protein ACRDHZ_26145, partial [Ktedonobacteraceae bacterium]
TTTITEHIEKARKVLQYEQRNNHQDKLVKGGLELFATRWAEEFQAACQAAGLDIRPIYRLMEHMEGYHRQDPIQRATNLRAALAILDTLEQDGAHERATDNHADPAEQRSQTSSSTLKRTLPPIPPTPSELPPVARMPPDLQKATQKMGEEQAQAENPIRLDRAMSAGHTSLVLLTADVTAVPGVGPSIAAKLRTLGIRTIRDLLFYFPRQHRDYGKLTKIAQIPFQEVTTTIGLIWDVETKRLNSGRTRTIARIGDETGQLHVSWFNQQYLQKQLNAAKGEYLVVTGIKQRFGNKVEFSVRSHELPERGDLLNTGRLVPVYPLTEGLHAKALLRYTKWTVDHYAHAVPEHLPAWLRTTGQFLPLPEAISQIHYPEHEQA